MPGEEFSLVSVSGKSPDGKNFRTDRDLFVIEANGFRAVDNSPRERATGRIPDKDDTRLRPPNIVLEVMPYSPTRAHAGTGDDDAGAVDVVVSRVKCKPGSENGSWFFLSS